jgi:hypothetical protein
MVCCGVFGRGANKFSTQKLTVLSNNSQWGGAVSSVYGNESSGSTRFVEFLENLRDCSLLNNDSDPWG